MTSHHRTGLRAFLREPLLHFFAIGACIYLAYGLVGPPETGPDDRTLTVTAGEVAWLKTSWRKRWNRPPNERELEGLLREHVKQAVLYRQALAMGLDQGDEVIRRRLAQKLLFLTSDLLQPAEPSEDDLRAYFEHNLERYRSPGLFTFTQVFVDPDKRGDRTLDDARAIKASLDATDPAVAGAAGDRFMLQAYYPERTQGEIGKLFGSEFAQSVSELGPGEWHGPVFSGYGVHLVYVHSRIVASTPSFALTRESVREDWIEHRRTVLNDKFLEGLLSRYDVVIEEGPNE